jgi:hypothetical protein
VKFLLDNWYWIVTALVSGGALMWPQLRARGAGGVSPQEAVQLINREKAVVIDVCEPAEFAAGHVGGSRNLSPSARSRAPKDCLRTSRSPWWWSVPAGHAPAAPPAN